jgi:KDO2-lipid IV(A) lauroyltransferase
MKQLIEFIAAWAILKGLGLLPRRAAVAAGRAVGWAAYRLAGGLRRTGRRNLEIAFPEKPVEERERILRATFAGLGRQLGEFSQLPKLRSSEDAAGVIRMENLEVATRAIESGRGVLFVTGHTGAWELTPVGLRLSGAPPMSFLVRRIDNARVERLADDYRTRCGNRTIDKREAARPVLEALRRGEAVGVLVDLNALEREGVFVDFFGTPASTSTGPAAFALRSNAVVVPAFARWDEAEQRHVLRFQEPLELDRTGSKEEDVRAATARITAALEAFVREHPDQWLWIHRRWKTRPPGEPGIYR